MTRARLAACVGGPVFKSLVLGWCLVLVACSGDDEEGGRDTTAADTQSPDTGSDTLVNDTEADAQDSVQPTACQDRQCGPDPITRQDCGTCATPGLGACNDGRCEATCDDTACGAMGYTSNTCVSSGPCDGGPEGSVQTFAFACSADRKTCEASASAPDCGLTITDCATCELDGGGLGLCEDDVCKMATSTQCQAGSCVDRSCGPAPVTGQDCGTCTEPGLLACNDGVCEATCDDAACGAMSFSSNTCVTEGECDGSPVDTILEVTFACSGDRKTCDFSATGLSCGLSMTECMACDFAGTDDGRCVAEVCVEAASSSCE